MKKKRIALLCKEMYRVPSRPVDGEWWNLHPEVKRPSPVIMIEYQDGEPVGICCRG